MLIHYKKYLYYIAIVRDNFSIRRWLASNSVQYPYVYPYIKTLGTNVINPITPPDSRHFLCIIKDQLRLHARLGLPQNIESDIWSYYEFLK